LGSDFLVCFSGGISDLILFVWVSFFGVRSIHFGGFFQDKRLTIVVAGFFQSSSLQPRPCRSFTLDAWPTHAREVSPWPGTCGSQLVFQGEVGGFSVDPRSSDGFLLLMRSPVAMRVVHVPSPATAPPDASPNLCFCFRLFYFVFLVFSSQFASVMLKSYWTICWPRC
jgi:hypothetical protein